MPLSGVNGNEPSPEPVPRQEKLVSTVVLVHGAFAESASWNDVVEELTAAGHDVVAVADPLRSLLRGFLIDPRPRCAWLKPGDLRSIRDGFF